MSSTIPYADLVLMDAEELESLLAIKTSLLCVVTFLSSAVFRSLGMFSYYVFIGNIIFDGYFLFFPCCW